MALRITGPGSNDTTLFDIGNQANGFFGTSPTDATYQIGSFKSFTIMVRARVSVNSGTIEILNGTASPSNNYIRVRGLDTTGGGLSLTIGINGVPTSFSASPAYTPSDEDDWAHFAVVSDGNDVTVYLNGDPVIQESGHSSPIDASTQLRHITAGATSRYQVHSHTARFSTLIGYAGALTHAQIQAAMHSRMPLPIPGKPLIAWGLGNAKEDTYGNLAANSRMSSGQVGGNNTAQSPASLTFDNEEEDGVGVFAPGLILASGAAAPAISPGGTPTPSDNTPVPTPGGTPTPSEGTPSQTIQSPATPSMAVGTNVNSASFWGRSRPFKDEWKNIGEMFYQGNPRGSGPWNAGFLVAGASNVNSEGYPTYLSPGIVASAICCRSQDGHYQGGNYHLLHDGSGTFDVDFDADGSTLSQVGPGHYTFEVNPGNGGIYVRILTTSPADPLTNIRVVPSPDLDSYVASPFREEFLDNLGATTNAAIRFMDLAHTNHNKIAEWSDRETTPGFQGRNHVGIAIEYMIEICNELNRDMWYCIPHLATNEFVTNAATKIAKNLASGLTCYVEYSNECWNSIFDQTDYVRDTGEALGLGNSRWQAGFYYYARRAGECMDLFYSVFDGEGRANELNRVYAGQAANIGVAQNGLNFENAWQKFDSLSIAPYMGGFMGNNPVANEVIANPDDWSPRYISNRLINEAIPDKAEDVRNHKALADNFGLTLNCYEAGQHLVGVGSFQGNQSIINAFTGANRDPAMSPAYDEYLKMLDNEGISLVCMFSDTGAYGRYGSWGHWEHYNQSPAPKRTAIINWMAQNEFDPVDPPPVSPEMTPGFVTPVTPSDDDNTPAPIVTPIETSPEDTPFEPDPQDTPAQGDPPTPYEPPPRPLPAGPPSVRAHARNRARARAQWNTARREYGRSMRVARSMRAPESGGVGKGTLEDAIRKYGMPTKPIGKKEGGAPRGINNVLGQSGQSRISQSVRNRLGKKKKKG